MKDRILSPRLRRFTLRAALLGGLALLLVLGAPQGARAGIVVLKNGEVLRARIRASEIEEEFVTLRWPYRNAIGPSAEIERGIWKLEMRQVRWYDPKADNLTEEYLEKYHDLKKFKLDPRFHGQVTSYLDRMRGKEEFVGQVLGKVDLNRELNRGPKLLPIRVPREHFEFKKIEGWDLKEENVEKGRKSSDKVLMLIGAKAVKGYKPRIHITSVKRPKLSTNAVFDWYIAEVRKLARNQLLDVREKMKEIHVGDKKKDVTLTTVTRHGEHVVLADRYVLFRKERVYFITCYAHEAQFFKLRSLFRKWRNDLLILEDEE